MATILVIDDMPVDRERAATCVRQCGATPVLAANGQEALDVIQQLNPDVIVTELLMPEERGLALITRILALNPSIPVILMTSPEGEPAAAKAVRAGASNYVSKDDLKRTLGEVLETVLTAVETARQRELFRRLLVQSRTEILLGYESGGAEAVISFLRDQLSQINFCHESELVRVSIALAEALRNALDHGNLELDSALRDSDDPDAYHRLGDFRATQPPYSERRVTVTTTLTAEEATFVIRDEGPGFDPSQLPDPTDPEVHLRASGRGIMIMRTFMDEVRYNAKGNEITLIKRRSLQGASSSQQPSDAGDHPP